MTTTLDDPTAAASTGAPAADQALVLLIGVGNPDRGDDEAGLAVARRLRETAAPGLVVREATGESSALLEAWRGYARVILVDAAHSGRKPGSVLRLDVGAGPLAASLLHDSTHAWGVAEAVELARALGRLPASLVVYAIEGRSFHPGHDLSPEVEDAVALVADAVSAEVAATTRQ